MLIRIWIWTFDQFLLSLTFGDGRLLTHHTATLQPPWLSLHSLRTDFLALLFLGTVFRSVFYCSVAVDRLHSIVSREIRVWMKICSCHVSPSLKVVTYEHTFCFSRWRWCHCLKLLATLLYAYNTCCSCFVLLIYQGQFPVWLEPSCSVRDQDHSQWALLVWQTGCLRPSLHCRLKWFRLVMVVCRII